LEKGGREVRARRKRFVGMRGESLLEPIFEKTKKVDKKTKKGLDKSQKM
jgi:hypothetical protein